ncbi:MAG: DUF1957 domain-containing protein [Spirochaetes bacterium]|nr:DUF1957 domain-containing protein [Spirochaetota bacterium]
MKNSYAISLVLHAHLPFVREYNGANDFRHAAEESRFFDALSETYIPLLQMFDRLENSRIPFKLGFSISPLLCQMLSDELLLKKYLAYTDKQIEFGKRELERTAATAGDSGALHALAKHNLDRIVDQKIVFQERYEGNILKTIDFYSRKGRLEILAGPVTHAFLPFQNLPGAIAAQIETALPFYRQHFGGRPYGFWLPELGWNASVESFLRYYGFGYTIVDTHGLIFGSPPPQKGSFYPIKTPGGIFVYGRDFYAAREIEAAAVDSVYRDNDKDAGYELSIEEISPFLNREGERRPTGFKYWHRCEADQNSVLCKDGLYDPKAAAEKAAEKAKTFLENRLKSLAAAGEHIEGTPISLCAYNADSFGRFWHEGTQFLEALFRLVAAPFGVPNGVPDGAPAGELAFVSPSEYLYEQDIASLQTSTPEFSSWGYNGYGETWLAASNDWMYRHIFRATERMVELAERFPDATGLKERALNQAAREILLAQSSDWPELLYRQDGASYARSRVEGSLRNFTTIYEALGSNYISTEWLTTLERRHNVFANINYRVFRRKK